MPETDGRGTGRTTSMLTHLVEEGGGVFVVRDYRYIPYVRDLLLHLYPEVVWNRARNRGEVKPGVFVEFIPQGSFMERRWMSSSHPVRLVWDHAVRMEVMES